jgi:hypothetical protein
MLKVATDTDYGRLSANPIGKHVVRLQRRSLGSTTWTNLVTLASSTPTGTYRATLRFFDTADYRAYFATPTAEGLRGDTSPTLRVTVAPCTANCPVPVAGP